MEAVNQFGWAEVSGIAGVTIVCLMTLLGILLGVILKRQKDSNNGPNQVRVLLSSIEGKVDAEIKDRKEDFAQLRDSIEQGRRESRIDIGELHKKFEAGFLRVTSEFRAMCNLRQTSCVEVQKSELKRAEAKVETACKKIAKVEQDSALKWEKQEKFNFECRKKS